MYIINPHIRVTLGSLDIDYQAVIDRAVALGYALPDTTNQTLQNQLVIDLKSAGIWAGFDVFYPFLTNVNFAKINWKTPTSNLCTFPGAIPTFGATGFTGNGTTMYINTNFAPSSGVNYTLNSAGHGCYIPTNYQTYQKEYHTADNVSDLNVSYFRALAPPGHTNLSINAWPGNILTTNTNSIGFYHNKRTSATALEVLKDGTSLGTSSTTSTGRSGYPFFILASNHAGTASAFNDRTISMFWAGAPMIGLETSFSTIINTFY